MLHTSPGREECVLGGGGGSEGRRTMQDRIEQNALELLHAIREHHPDIYAGAWVNPYKSLHGSAGGWSGPRFYPLQSGYGIFAGRGRIGGSGGIPRARGRRPALHHHAAGHGDAARSVISASLSPGPMAPDWSYPRSGRTVLSEV